MTRIECVRQTLGSEADILLACEELDRTARSKRMGTQKKEEVEAAAADWVDEGDWAAVQDH
jgi:hypothetical protein